MIHNLQSTIERMARNRRPWRFCVRHFHWHSNAPLPRSVAHSDHAAERPRRRLGLSVLVNGFDAWVETANGTFSFSSQCYAPDVIGGDGVQRIEAFDWEP